MSSRTATNASAKAWAWLGATLAFCLAVLAFPAAPPGLSGLRLIAKLPGPDGAWDYASFDAARRRVYVAHGTEVMVIDAASNKVTPNFAPGSHVHSVLAIPGTGLIATTNGDDASVKIINADTGAVIASVAMAPDPDGAVFDPQSGLLLVMGGDSALVSLVDVKGAKVVATIPVGGSLEFPAVDGKGHLFVNNKEHGEIDVIDLSARKVTRRYPMAGCQAPSGLAYVEGDRLISSCRNGVAKILNAATGQQIATVPIGEWPDSVLYDPKRELAMVPSARVGTLTVIALSGPKNNTVIDAVPTGVGAHTGAIDVETGRVYLPAAEFETPIPTNKRPTLKPGTFGILVLDR